MLAANLLKAVISKLNFVGIAQWEPLSENECFILLWGICVRIRMFT